MFRSSILLVVVSAIILRSAAFVPTRQAFVRSRGTAASSTPLFLSSRTSHPDDWELPDRKPESSASRRTDESYTTTTTTPSSKFILGDDLHLLREKVMDMRQELLQARGRNARQRVKELERAILRVQQVDAEFVYAVALERMQTAKSPEEVEQYEQQALEARAALPQFQMEGLWVGKYGDSSYEMINVTYVGDTLIAYKVTGHSNVPKGEVSFQVDLSPEAVAQEMLEPIALEDDAVDQWGSRFLSRYAGDGQVASKGFVNNQFVEGQLILVNEYFSFAWMPIGHQVFFGRPSPDLTLQMLRDADAPHSPEEEMRVHLERCLEETAILEEEEIDDKSFFSPNQQDYYRQEGCFE